MPRGYDRALYILPFDHRGSFQAKMFGRKSPLSEAQTAEISRTKEVMYDGFNAALASAVAEIAKRYHEFVVLFERASHLSCELSDHTRSGHYSSKEA
jgi:hypothetical protein